MPNRPASPAQAYAGRPSALTAGVTAPVLAALLWSACAPPGGGEAVVLEVSELASPAGEGSGQPFLSSGGDAVYMSWQEPAAPAGHAVKVARLDGSGWGEAAVAAQGEDFFVNWADFPSVVRDAGGRLWVHWLQRLQGEGLAYAVRISSSDDGGRTWSEAWTPHEDGTATEHGFVSMVPWGDGVGVAWLDGRLYAPGDDGTPPSREMTVRWRTVAGDGTPGPETLLDPRACDCCQTGAALTDEGPIVVYRDRTAGEVRDIHLVRWTPDGWAPDVRVHADDWVIGGCPVNGPAVAAQGSHVAVAWFTGAGDVAKVLAAFSDDAGRTFGAPVRVDAGDPAGRVDLLLLEDGTALVSWLERTGGDAAELRVSRVAASGPVWVGSVSGASSARASGFPRMTRPSWDRDGVLIAWTDATDADAPRVRMVRVALP